MAAAELSSWESSLGELPHIHPNQPCFAFNVFSFSASLSTWFQIYYSNKNLLIN